MPYLGPSINATIRSISPKILNIHKRGRNDVLFICERAIKARLAAVKSPNAAGIAQAGFSPALTTPGIRKDKPAKRKVCKMSTGCTAFLSSNSCNRGQKYSLPILFHTIRLVKTLIVNKIVVSIIDLFFKYKGNRETWKSRCQMTKTELSYGNKSI